MVDLPQIEFVKDYKLLRCYWPDSKELNDQLKAVALAQQEKDPKGVVYSNVGGWHSKTELHKVDSECVKTLVSRTAMAFQEMVKQMAEDKQIVLDGMWVNVNRKGHKNYPHIHTYAWSGCYYVDAGNHDSGYTKFVKDRKKMPAGHTSSAVFLPDNVKRRHMPDTTNEPLEEYTLRLQEGLMVVFPGTLLHYVEPYLGDGTRISIAFNASSA